MSTLHKNVLGPTFVQEILLFINFVAKFNEISLTCDDQIFWTESPIYLI